MINALARLESLTINGKTIQVSPLLAGGLSPHTFDARAQDARHVMTWLVETKRTLGELGELDVIAFRAWCAEQWKPNTVNRRLATLRLLCRRLVKLGHIDADPTADVGGYIAGAGEHTAALTWGEASRLVEACRHDPTPRGPRDLALIRIGLRTGMRRAELLRLALADVVRHQGHPSAWIKVKRSKRVRVKLTAVMDDLAAWLDLSAELGADPMGGPVARGIVGPRRAAALVRFQLTPQMSARAFDRMVERRGVQAGIPFRVTPHVLRASYITLGLEAGAKLQRMASSVGHSSLRTTAGYDARRDDFANHPTDLLDGI